MIAPDYVWNDANEELVARYPDRFRAAVSGAGASNWTSNYAHSDVARTKELEFMGRPWEPEAREIMIRQSAYLNSGGVQAATLFVHGEVDLDAVLRPEAAE